MAEGEHVVVGIDLGTSGLKVVALADDGRVVASRRRGYPTFRPVPGAAEQLPHDWLDALEFALGELAREVEPTRWAAFGLSAMLPTLVELDADNNARWPALTWEDARSEHEGDRMRELIGAERSYRVTGARLDGRYLLPMHAGRSAHREDSRVAAIAGAKDYLFAWLTGELLTDPSTAAGYGCFDVGVGAWDDEMQGLAGDVRLPEVAASAQWRSLRADLAERFCCDRLPVVLGAADSVLGAYGLGVTEPGRTAYVAGTSTAILGFSGVLALDARQRYLVTPMAEGGYGLEMDLLATGSSLSWLAGLFGLAGGAAEVAELAEGALVQNAPVFLPYLAPGEQGALWNPRLSGTLCELSVRTSRADLARSLLTGIVVESMRCLAVLDEAMGATPGSLDDEPIRVSGSSAASTVFRRDLADSSGRPVAAYAGGPDHSALGAALLAARSALGWQVETPGPTVFVEPDPARAAIWADRAAEHDAARRALFPDSPGSADRPAGPSKVTVTR